MRPRADGRGMVNVLAADKLMQRPQLYATFLLWLLSRAVRAVARSRRSRQPKLVFFFDEAHLLFTMRRRRCVDKIEQVVRLIRSKGVGVYFVTQNPLDVPDDVLGQLGNRVQHALRAFTPRDQKAVQAAAETFRPNPSFRRERRSPSWRRRGAGVVARRAGACPSRSSVRGFVPPRGRIGPITPQERAASILRASPVAGLYEQPIDRESAYAASAGSCLGPRSSQRRPATAGAGARR